MSLGHEGVSILWLSEEFDVTRHTVRKRILDAGIQPSGRSGSNPVYRIADVAPLLCQSVAGDDWSNVDPDTLAPMEQQQYWNAQKLKIQTSKERDNLLLSRGQLFACEQVEYGVASLLRGLREGVMVLSDVMVAEAGLSEKQRAVVEQQSDIFLANLSHGARKITVPEGDNEDDDQLPTD